MLTKPVLIQKRRFEADEHRRAVAERELAIYVESLSHDMQYDCRRACWLLEMLALPRRLTRAQQLIELTKRLARHREALASNPGRKYLGRAWTLAQLRRLFYARAGFRRPTPRPVTRQEVEEYIPTIPPVEQKRREKAQA